MNYFLLSLLLIINYNDAEDINRNNSAHWNDSFAVNIGAGYEVGSDQSTNKSLQSTNNISQSQNHLSSILLRETIPKNIREPRILTNFTPIVGTPNPKNMKNQFEFKNHLDDSRPAASNNFRTNNFQNYQVHETLSDDDNKYLNVKPSLRDLHNIVNGLEKSKPYSKIVQVIKVPAIYEIHLQSDVDKKNHVNLLPGDFNHNENLNWVDHYENKPILNNLNHNEHLGWTNRYQNKPAANNFNKELLSDDYLKWLNNYYKQREDAFSKGSEKYNGPSSITSQENYIKPEWVDHLQENEFLEPIISHHYRHTQNLDDKYDKAVFGNYNAHSKKKPFTSTWQHRDYFPHKNVHYANNNLKRDTGVRNFNLISPSYSTSLNKFPQGKQLLNINYKKTNLNSKPIVQNQEITEFNHPEAIHEVPAPYLGKYAYPRPFQAQSFSKTNTYSKPLPTPENNLNHVKFKNFVPTVKPTQRIYPEFSTPPVTSAPFDKHSSIFPESVYGLISDKNYNHRFRDILEPETVPTSEEFASYINENQNLVYGKQTEAVLSPYEINIPVTHQTTPKAFSNNRENMIYKDNHFDYPDINVDFHRGSNYGGIYNQNVLQRVSTDQMPDNPFQSKDCTENAKLYENVPITTHAPDIGSYNNNNQEAFNKKSSTNEYGGDNVKNKSQDIMNAESKQNLNSTKRLYEDTYNNYIIKKYPQYTLADTIKNLSSKIFSKNRYMNKSPLKEMTGKQNNGARLDYIIYITEKTKHEDDK